MAQAPQVPHDDFGDRYAIERELGHGATATVYLARDLKFDGRLVAIKVLSEHFALPVPRERFLREIQTTAKLNHPHIVTLLESGTTRAEPQRPFYVMRFIDGEVLRDVVARGPLAVLEALRITRQVAGALGHAHRHRVIHRDIKPGNIMIEDGHTWVTDFGIARAMAATDSQTVTSTGVTIGTPAYMSPEQAMGRGNLDARSDIYSLGCVLYEMLAGKMPFDGPDVQVILNKHLAEPLPPIRELRTDVPERVTQLLEIALAKKPEERFATAAEFAEALSLHGAGPLTPTRTQPVPPRRRVRMRQRTVGVIGGAFVLAAVFLVWRLAIGGVGALDPTAYFVAPFGRAEGVPIALDAGRLLQDALNGWSGIKVLGRFESPETSGAVDGVGARRLARNQRAGYYVRGEASPVGDSIRVRAALYTTSNGALVRERAVTLQLSLMGADSLIATLADRVLFDDTVVAANGGRAGTRSYAARQAFALGVAAVQKWELVAADSAFRQASDLDPGYAQAHLWVAQVRFWGDAAVATWRSAAERAGSSRERLSVRDQALSDALVAFGRENVARACAGWERLTRRAPHDFSPWYGLATCMTRDQAVLPDRTSASQWRFRSSYYRATKAYERAFQLLPSIHRALSGDSYAAVRRLLITNGSTVLFGRAIAPDTTTFAAYPTWQGDTLALVPYPQQRFARRDVMPPPGKSLAVYHERELFHQIATAWATAFPEGAEAMGALALSLELLGDPAALDTLRRARSLKNTIEGNVRLAGAEVWMRVKFSVPSDPVSLRTARAVADSLLDPKSSQSSREPLLLASLAVLTGRANLAARLIRHSRVVADWGVPGPLARSAGPLLVFAALGGPEDSLRDLEQRVDSAITQHLPTPMQQGARMNWLGRPAALAFPTHPFASHGRLVGGGIAQLDADAAFLRSDTGTVRRVFANIRTVRRFAAPADLTLDALYPEAWLLAVLPDPEAAIGWLDPTLTTLEAGAPEKLVDPANAAALVRAMALRAELAERTGDSLGAARWARHVVILWSDADPFLQPIVRNMERLSALSKAVN